MNWKFFLIGCSFFAIAQSITWFTSNLQLMYPYFKTWKGIAWLVLLAMPASVGYMMATKYLYTAMDNSLWSVRLIGFSMGVFSFTVLIVSLSEIFVTSRSLISKPIASPSLDVV